MAGSDAKSKDGAGYEIAFFVLVGALLFFALMIPAALGIGLFWATRDRFTRKEGALIAGVSIVAFWIADAASGGALLGSYFRWLGVLVSGKGNRLDVPMVSIVLGAVALFGICLALQDSKIAAWGIKSVRKKPAVGERESVIPSDRELQRITIAPTPIEAIAPRADMHASSGGGVQGHRDFPLGRGRDGSPVSINENEVGTHMMIFGATGSGKTTTIEVIAGALLDYGWAGTIIDQKEDTAAGGFYDWCRAYSHAHAIPFQELRLSDPTPRCWFNPLENMGPDEARDTILSLVELEDAYWAAINKKTLGQVCSLFWMAHEIDPIRFPTPSMREIGLFLEKPDLRSAAKERMALIKVHQPQFTEEDFSSLMRPTKQEAEAATGFGARITGVYSTQAGRAVLSPQDNRYSLDITQGGLTYIGLDSLGKQDLTKMVSASVLQRLSVYASQRTTGQLASNVKRFVLVDEAASVDRKILQNLLSRARSAGIALILATQGPLDWDIGKRNSADPGFRDLGQNCNVAVIMRQGEPENAEACADYLGMDRQSQFSQSVREGELVEGGSISQVRDWKVGPDELRALTRGQAILRVGDPNHRVEWATVTPRDPSYVPAHAGVR